MRVSAPVIMTGTVHRLLELAVPELPAHSQQEHLGWEPVLGERFGLSSSTTIHPVTHASGTPIRQRNSASWATTNRVVAQDENILMLVSCSSHDQPPYSGCEDGQIPELARANNLL